MENGDQYIGSTGHTRTSASRVIRAKLTALHVEQTDEMVDTILTEWIKRPAQFKGYAEGLRMFVYHWTQISYPAWAAERAKKGGHPAAAAPKRRRPGRPVTTGKTPPRSMRLGDVYDLAQVKAKKEGRTVTDVVERKLTEYLTDPPTAGNYGMLVDAESYETIRPATVDEWAETVVARTRRNLWEEEHPETQPWPGPDDVVVVGGRRCRVSTVHGDTIEAAWMWLADGRLTVFGGIEVLHEAPCPSHAEARAVAARLQFVPLTSWRDWRDHDNGDALALKR